MIKKTGSTQLFDFFEGKLWANIDWEESIVIRLFRLWIQYNWEHFSEIRLYVDYSGNNWKNVKYLAVPKGKFRIIKGIIELSKESYDSSLKEVLDETK